MTTFRTVLKWIVHSELFSQFKKPTPGKICFNFIIERNVHICCAQYYILWLIVLVFSNSNIVWRVPYIIISLYFVNDDTLVFEAITSKIIHFGWPKLSSKQKSQMLYHANSWHNSSICGFFEYFQGLNQIRSEKFILIIFWEFCV